MLYKKVLIRTGTNEPQVVSRHLLTFLNVLQLCRGGQFWPQLFTPYKKSKKNENILRIKYKKMFWATEQSINKKNIITNLENKQLIVGQSTQYQM